MTGQRSMRVGLYLFVAYAFSWTFGLLQLLVPADLSTTTSSILKTLIAVVFMFGPLVGAVVAQRAAGERVLRPLGVAGRVNAWWLVAWLGPFAYAALTLACALPLPDVEWSPDLAGFWDRMTAALPPDQLAEARAEMEEMPKALLYLMLVVQPLLAGLSINMIAAFGEELGWRGFMYRAWAHLGFWRSSFAVGAVWGFWHAPLIAQGHNYAEHPYVGVVMMVVWCALLGPPFQYLRLRTGSVIAASIAHGTLNGSAGIALMFIAGGNDLTVGVTGLAGFLALVVIKGAILVFAKDLDLSSERPAQPAV